MAQRHEKVAILGAGVSGLSCAWLLTRRGIDVTIFESTDRIGGLARSFAWHGFCCDIGPHRLFTLDEAVLRQLLTLVPMHRHERHSKIFIGGKAIRDPLNPFELILRFPLRITSRLVAGYLFRPKLPEDSFRNLVLNNFGRGLHEFFFEPYTQKLFGVPPSQISAEWGRQKIRVSGLLDVLQRNTKVFFRDFYYPKRGGYGAIAETLYRPVRDTVRFNARVSALEACNGHIGAVRYEQDGALKTFRCDRVISTIPATVLGQMFDHDFKLRFKSVQLIYLLIDKPRVMPYHWIYFGDKDVVINRLAEFKNFSTEEAPADRTVLVAEVTVPTKNPVDDVLAALKHYKLVQAEEVIDTKVLQEPFGYPVYDTDFEAARQEARRLFGGYRNLHLVGRNAEFRHIEVDEDFSSALVLVRRLYDAGPAA